MTGKALTLHQPYASLIVAGVKTIETRSRRMNYRGRLYVHAALRKPVDVGGWAVDPDGQAGDADWYATEDGNTYMALPLGAVVGHVDVVDCLPILGRLALMPRSGEHRRAMFADDRGGRVRVSEFRWMDGVNKITRWAIHDDQPPFGDFTPGRWAILLANPVRYDEPIPAKGKQGLWTFDDGEDG